MIVTVCRRCTECHVGCHATCERYLEQRAELNRIRDIQRKDEQIRNTIIGRVIEEADKARRKSFKRFKR